VFAHRLPLEKQQAARKQAGCSKTSRLLVSSSLLEKEQAALYKAARSLL
jgi:hypothetical protein